MGELRSSSWFSGENETTLLHRVAFRTSGLDLSNGCDRPVIGIAQSVSGLNPCSLPLTDLAKAAAEGVRSAGGTPVLFPTMTLGEDLMKPSAMLYRNLLSIEVEETIRAYPLDGVIIMGSCDKTIPGALMGAVSADLPTIVVVGGPRTPALFRGKQIGTGTALWRLWDERRAGNLDDDEWVELEQCLSCGTGTCNTMGTASTMAILVEALGLAVPGSSTIPAGDVRGAARAVEAGEHIVSAVRSERRPSRILTVASLTNAVRVLHAIAGSTNAIIHLTALAGRLGLSFSLDDFHRLGTDVPVLADIEPTGKYLLQEFDTAGGVPALMREIATHLDLSASTVMGRTISDIVSNVARTGDAIRSVDQPLRAGGAFAIVRGTLAPDGAVVKTSAASDHLLEHRGPAVVFSSYSEMLARVDDPALDVDEDSVLILRGCGPVGAPGMPEWGMVPIPEKLARKGVRDMVRVTDARMSGTGFGTVFLHVAPEAAIGGPLALVQNGDIVRVSVASRTLDLEVGDAEMAERRARWTPPESPHLRGWPSLYRSEVTQANEGCDLRFLQAPTAAMRRFVEPEIGRS